MNKILLTVLSILFIGPGFAEDNRLPFDAHMHYWPEHDQFIGIEKEVCEDEFEVINGVRRAVNTSIANYQEAH